MKKSQKGFVPLLILTIVALVAIGTGIYYFQQNNKNKNQTNGDASFTKIDASTYLPGKIFVSTLASSETGTFKSDHTIILNWGLDYAGTNDTRARGGIGTWSVSDNILTIKGSSLDDGNYDFNTLNQKKVGNEIVVGKWSTLADGRLTGFFVGRDLNIIETLTRLNPQTNKLVDTSNWKTYTNTDYGFSVRYPAEWSLSLKQNDSISGSLLTLNFSRGKTLEVGKDEFDGFVSCFARVKNLDPFYLGVFQSSEPISIDGVVSNIYKDQNRGLESLNFYIPLIKQDASRCGIFFQGFSALSDFSKKDIITSLKFTNGFESFIQAVSKQYKTNPPIRG